MLHLSPREASDAQPHRGVSRNGGRDYAVHFFLKPAAKERFGQRTDSRALLAKSQTC